MNATAAQRLLNEAHTRRLAGDMSAAHALYWRAAQLEWKYVQGLPPERVRSRAVYGLDALSHFLQGGDPDMARTVAEFLLRQETLEPYSHADVRRVLERSEE